MEGTAVYVVVEETYKVSVPGGIDNFLEKVSVLKGFVKDVSDNPKVCVESAGDLVYRNPNQIYQTIKEAVIVAKEKAKELDERKRYETSRDFRPFACGGSSPKYKWMQDSDRFPEYRKYCWWLDCEQDERNEIIDCGSRDKRDKAKFVGFMLLSFGGVIGGSESGDAAVTGLEYRKNPSFRSKEELLVTIESARHGLKVTEIVDVTGTTAMGMIVVLADYLKAWTLGSRLAGIQGKADASD